MSFTFLEKTVTIGGTDYKFRELTVAENDLCADAAREPNGDINGRRMMRLMVSKSIVEPKMSLDDIAGIPNRLYLRFCEAVNDLNSSDDDEDESGNE